MEIERFKFEVDLPRLTPFEIRCLRQLKTRGGVLSELELVVERDAQSAALLNRIVALGLVGRATHENPPVYWLTEIGRQALDYLDPVSVAKCAYSSSEGAG